MLKIREFVKAGSLEEAYELNQKRSSCVLGGMVWLKMSDKRVGTAIDLSGLGLDTIEEKEDEFVIGCMTSLRTLEMNTALDAYTDGAVKESLRHIVGVQFRNCATVGGSVFGRYGFSDVLTMLLVLDTYVELYKGGRIPLEKFIAMKKDRDILVNVIVKKKPLRVAYLSQRNSKTDFPVLACAVALDSQGVRLSVGARPGQAVAWEEKMATPFNTDSMTEEQWREEVEAFAKRAAAVVPVGENMRASREYRRHLVQVLTRRALLAAGGNKR